ncbi:MAG: hypothetical protein JF599_08375 [Verrucomicrobia bacterium]|nr:hypothetical protein [Verrucomicrobiota bacterium]
MVSTRQLTALLCAIALAASMLAVRQLLAPRPAVPPADTTPARHAPLTSSNQPLHPNTPPATTPASADQNLLAERRCLALAERDPIEALEFALDHHLLETQPGLLENLTGQWASHDFKAAHEWLGKQEPSDWRDQLMARVAYVRSQSDPAAAAQIVSKEITPGPRQNEAAISVLHQWARRDAAAAATWVAAFPPGDLRTRAQAEIEGLRRYQALTPARP